MRGECDVPSREPCPLRIDQRTLNRLSWSTRLIAASSPLGESFVWKTTPKDPLPTILHWVYCISLVSPVRPSCTFSLTTSNGMCQRTCSRTRARIVIWSRDQGKPTAHAQARKCCSWPVLGHCQVLGMCGIHFGDRAVGGGRQQNCLKIGAKRRRRR